MSATTTATTTDRPSSRARAALTVASIGAAVTAADLLTKQWAERALADGPIAVAGPVGLSLGHNSGVAFGVGDQAPALLLTGVALVLAVGVLVAGVRSHVPAWAAVLLVGGAVGNILDRAPDGVVTDFIDVGWWPTFNLADSAIVAGALAVAWLSHRQQPRDTHDGESA